MRVVRDLTDRQKQIYTYIRKRIQGGMPPTLADMMDEFGFKSTNSVRGHLRLIQKKGYIVCKAGMARGLYLTEKDVMNDAVGLPSSYGRSSEAID
jgi:repressor LexA